VGCSCCDYASAAGEQFTAERAAKELRAYRRGRVGPTTRLLRDGLVNNGLNHGVLLDVGVGIGALSFELLERGFTRAVGVDASRSYLAAAAEEASRRQRSESISFVHGDFVNLAKGLPDADVVTLDRVVCCYPDYRSLLGEAIQHAERGFALSYPRDRWFVRWGMRAENAFRRLGSDSFRTFVHPRAGMERLIGDAGFNLVSRNQTAIWAADVYARRPTAGAA
jgi:SAM-dependent methyltransferase